MNPKVVEYMTIQTFKQCFRTVFMDLDEEITDDHKNKLEQCLSSYIKSYQFVGVGFMLNHSETDPLEQLK